ncbi:MAG: lipid-A-disaccharide synthase N-terminal domain-containing protein [Halobacteriota archaeon]
MMFDTEHVWLVIGFLGQIFFSARFLVQWLASEKQKQSVIPVAFWYFSIGGGLLLFAYSIYRMDPVFIAGQSLGIFIYTRNLYLIHNAELKADAAPQVQAARA